MKQLALFDFDGTITTKDSLLDFIQYAVGKPAYYWGLVSMSPVLVGFALKVTPNYIAKEKLIGHYFKGWSCDKFGDVAKRYSLEEIDPIVRPKAFEKINWHKAQGHHVVIVSASMENWLAPWCERNGLELIGTQLGEDNGLLTGKFATNNCHGEEKVNRIKARFELSDYELIYAYGDTSGDKQMLEMADKPHFRYFE